MSRFVGIEDAVDAWQFTIVHPCGKRTKVRIPGELGVAMRSAPASQRAEAFAKCVHTALVSAGHGRVEEIG